MLTEQGLFSNPAGREVETPLLLMDQWPAVSPDAEVMTKTEQLSSAIILSFSSYILTPAQEMTG